MRAKGSRKTPGSGRKAGTPNKMTAALKDIILQALSQAGGVEYLRQRALDSPAAFLALVGRVLPLQVKEGGDEPRMPKTVVHEHRPSAPVLPAVAHEEPPCPTNVG